MDPKIGVFVCSGCGIGDALDTDDLCEAADEAGAHVTPEAILEVGLIRNLRHKVKVLGEGELKKKLKVEAAKFSKSAEEKIKAAGGEAVLA